MNDNDYIPYDTVPILGVLVRYDSILVSSFCFTRSCVLRVDFWRRHVWQQLAHFRPSVNTHNTVSKQMFPYELGHHLVVSRNTLLYESTDYNATTTIRAWVSRYPSVSSPSAPKENFWG